LGTADVVVTIKRCRDTPHAVLEETFHHSLGDYHSETVYRFCYCRETIKFGERFGAEQRVRVIIGLPIQSQDKVDYSCQVQILGLGDEQIRSIYGLDSMQALQLALRFLSEQLADYRKNLRWVGNEDIGL